VDGVFGTHTPPLSGSSGTRFRHCAHHRPGGALVRLGLNKMSGTVTDLRGLGLAMAMWEAMGVL